MRLYTMIFYLSVIFVVSIRAAGGQELPQSVISGERVGLASRVLGEDRQLIVHVPRSYGQGNDSYGVLYLLDGNPNFLHATAIAEFLARDGLAPELIVVAIVNSDRNRDLTPPSQSQVEIDAFPTHGGAGEFREFLRLELLPWVDRNYRVNEFQLLVGHSFGGLFAIDTFISEPRIFDAYVAVSPSLQWNEQALVKAARTVFDKGADSSASLFVAVGNERGALLGGVRQFIGILDTLGPRGLRWDFRRLPEETHNTVALPGIYQGIRSVFQDWQISDAAGLAAFNQSGIDGVHELFRARDERFGLGGSGRAPYARILNLTNFLIGSGRLDEAVAVALHDVSEFPVTETLVDRLTDAYVRNGDEGAAISYLQRVLELDPNNEAAERNLVGLGIDPAP